VKKTHFKFLGFFRWKNDHERDENVRKRPGRAALGAPAPTPCAPTPRTTVISASAAPACSSKRPDASENWILLDFQVGSTQQA